MKKKTFWGLAAVFLFFYGAGHSATIQAQENGDYDFEPSATLTVAGRGEVSAPPDQAVLRLGAVSQAEKAAAAQGEVNEVVGRIVQALKGIGVPDKKISTVELSLIPVYGDRQPRPPSGGRPMEPVIQGYRASDIIQVEVEDLGKIGNVIDAGIGAGANRLEGLSFGLRDDSELRNEALRRAANEAKAKAESVSKAMGVRLVGVQEITEGGVNLQHPQMRFSASYVKSYEATPIQPGQVKVEASLTVSYDVVQLEKLPPPNDRITSAVRKD